MKYDNVNLWFAKDENDNIVTIDEVNKETRDEHKFYCPICGSQIKPKQGDIMSWHFAHEDKTKCDGESRIHWWVKNKLIDVGTKFIVKTDKEKEYICKEFFIEKSYEVNENTYKPDLVVETECGETIFFEIEHTNKKKPEDYMSSWIELNNIVAEVNTKDLINTDSKALPVFKALFYGGKCREVKKGNAYYNSIGLHSEKILNENNYNEKSKERVKKLNWMWSDIVKYKNNSEDIEHICGIIDSIEDSEDRIIIANILKKPKCSNILLDYINYKTNNIKNKLEPYIEKFEKLDSRIELDFQIENNIHEKIYGNNTIELKIDNQSLYARYGKITFNDIDDVIHKLEEVYITIIKYNQIYKVIDYINKQYDYKSECKNIRDFITPTLEIRKTYNDIHENSSIRLELYNYDNCKSNVSWWNYIHLHDTPLEKIDNYPKAFNYIETEIYKKIDNMPYDLKYVKNFDYIVEKLKEKFTYKNDDYSWEIESKLRSNKLEIYLTLYNPYKKVYDEIIIDNLKLIINNEVVIERINEDFDSNIILNLISERFENIIINEFPVNEKINKSLENLRCYFLEGKNIDLKLNIISHYEAELKFIYFNDTNKLTIKNGNLYRYNFKLCSFIDKQETEIVNILKSLLQSLLFTDVCELKNDRYKELIVSLNHRYSTLFDTWRIAKYEENGMLFLNLLNHENTLVSKYTINKNDDFSTEVLRNEIISQFSNDIRKFKYQ